MADFRARQRVQIHDGTDEFGVLSSKPVFVSIQDGGNVITVDATDFDIRDLLKTQDSIAIWTNTAKDGSGTDYQPLVDTDGHLQVDVLTSPTGIAKVDDAAFAIATDSVSPMGALADETAPDSVDEGDVGIPRMTLDRKLLIRLVGASDSDRVDVDSSGNIKAILAANDGVDIGDVTINNASIVVTATDLDIRDLTHVSDSVQVGDGTDLWAIDSSGRGSVSLDAVTVTAVPISATAAANTEINPIFVQVVSGATSGTEIHDYDTAAGVAKDATSNHDYTVTSAKTFLLQQIVVAASGAMKIEVQTGPVAGLVTQAVIFTSGAKPTEIITFAKPIEVPDTSTGTVRLIRRNDDNQAMDVYSTIIGSEI